MVNETMHDCVTEKMLADEIGRTVRTLQRWRSERSGPPFIRLGRQILYRRESVQQWLKSLEQEQPRSNRQ